MHSATDLQQTIDLIAGSFGVVTFPCKVQRLSPGTRALAARVLAGEYGRDMVEPDFDLPEDDGTQSPELRGAQAVMLIAEKAPLRVMPDERLAGAAPLLGATYHRKPIGGLGSTSHTTIGFERPLQIGLAGVRAEIEERRSREPLTREQREFLDAMTMCLDAMRVWHRRLMDELQLRMEAAGEPERSTYARVRHTLQRVPELPPGTFAEAVQALWFLWEFQRLCGNWSGIGRIDKILGPYLDRDLAAGTMDLDTARELLAHFWIKGAEWKGCGNSHYGTSGDAQFYQNIVLGGVDKQGDALVNEVTYLVLDVAEELHISDFPIAVRVGEQTPERLWRRIAEVQRLGGGIVSIYNDALVIDAMVRFGYPIEEARDFANDGCWEVLVPGKTAFSYAPFDMLRPLQEVLGLGPEATESSPPEYPDFEALYQAFLQALRNKPLAIVYDSTLAQFDGGMPSPLLSLFVEGCLENARGYHKRGAKYSVRSPHAGGMPDTANALFAIRRLVYEERRFTLPELIDILRRDWDGHELLRRELRTTLVLYGNDSDDADAMLKRVYDDYTAIVAERPSMNGLLLPCGISTFAREIAYREHRAALPFGTHAGEILATNLAPTPGTDKRGPTAVMASFCKLDFHKVPCGVPLEIKLHPSCLRDEKGIDALIALLKTFVRMGGFYLQLDVVDSNVLRDAQKRPELYPNLAVRISGWSARFTTLSREWQDMIIQRTEQMTLG